MSGNSPSQQRFGCYIGNIDRSVSLELLKQLFSQCGTIVDCSLNGRDEDPFRYGFIDFATEEDRSRAMKFNAFVLHERKLKVGISKGNVNKPDGPSAHKRNQLGEGNTNNNNNSNNNNINSKVGQASNSSIPGLPTNLTSGLSSAQMDILMQVLQNAQQQGQNPAAAVLAAAGPNMLLPNSTGSSAGAAMPAPFSSIPPPPPSVGASINYPTNISLNGSNPHSSVMGGGGTGVWGGPGGMPQMPGGQGGMMPGHGGYMAGPMNPMNGPGGLMPAHPHHAFHSRGMPFSRGPANPPPSVEVLQLRERQRAEFIDVVRKDAEKYEKKMEKKHKKKESEKEGIHSSEEEEDDSDDEHDDKKKRKLETSEEVHEKGSD